MTDALAILTTVWTPATVGVAVIGGLTLGYLLLGYLAELPAYATQARPAQLARTILGSAVVVGFVYYVGQAGAGVIDGSPDWDRVISGFGLWSLYAIGMAVGLYARLTRHYARRHQANDTRAHAEIDDL